MLRGKSNPVHYSVELVVPQRLSRFCRIADIAANHLRALRHKIVPLAAVEQIQLYAALHSQPGDSLADQSCSANK
ncbi:hypothetical protein D3C86_1973430 [compost metagenome]